MFVFEDVASEEEMPDLSGLEGGGDSGGDSVALDELLESAQEGYRIVLHISSKLQK